MKVSPTRRAPYLTLILISAIFIQNFSAVQCAKKQHKSPEVQKQKGKNHKAAKQRKDVPVHGVKKPGLEKKWCIPKLDTSVATLEGNIDFLCGGGRVDCSGIKAGGVCFEPNNVWSHAAYAMNAFYHARGQKDCKFAGSGVLTTVDHTIGGMCFANQGKLSHQKSWSPKPASRGPVKNWCIPKPRTSSSKMKRSIDFACTKIDCKPIQAGGECYDPNTLRAHAAYAMNSYYQLSGQRECDFANTGWITIDDPSTGSCIYPFSRSGVKLLAQNR